jgi:hypothetical protein
MENTLSDLFERAESWPQAAKDELLRVASEIEKEKVGVYVVNEAEREAIDAGLQDVKNDRFASDVEMEILFAKCRN